jgi:hypothetical protein
MSAMTSFVSHTAVDCRDAYALSTWWKQVLGYVDVADDPNEPGDEECMILSADSGHRLLFIEVPEAKQVKNRLHLDLRPRDSTRAEEVRRLLGIGATVVADHSDIHGPGIGWVTMADPEGNEFCVLRSEAEIAAASERAAGAVVEASAEGAAKAAPPGASPTGGSAAGAPAGAAAGSAAGSADV